MAVLVPEPSIEDPTIKDWEKLLSRVTFQAGGFMLLSLENMDSTGVPRVMQGSRFQINHALFLVETTESISGVPVLNQVNYVYAVPNGETATFVYSTTVPVFDPVFGGWYNGDRRAVAKMIYGANNTFWNKVILDTEGSIRNFNPNSDTLPTFGGKLIIEAGVVGGLVFDVLRPGAYYLEVRGGKGGDGGNGGSDGRDGEKGSQGDYGDYKTVSFILTQYSMVALHRGNDGNNGGNGGYGYSNGSGGGSGKNGKASYIHIENFGLLYMLGGRGGRGGSGRGGGSGGAGGGGGDSPARDKITWNGLTDAITSNNGIDGGAGNSGSNITAGGAGATTFLSTSSGYARIYKL